MWRWRLSTVRALGGRDTNTRLSLLFNPRHSRTRYVHAHAVPVADLVEKLDGVASYPASSLDAFSTLKSDGDPCRAAHPRISYSAVDALRRFLSPENVVSDRPLIYSPTAIRSLYYRAESRSQLEMLDAKMLTHLISLFGSLSAGPCTSVVYGNPLTSRFLEVSTHRTHWTFVLKVGRYKSTQEMPLQDSDRYWLMCAELAIVQAGPPSESLSGEAYSAILRARTHYHIIRRHTRRLEVHTYYIETLLAIRDTRLLDFAARDLSFLLRNHSTCRPWLQRLLCRLVIQHRESLSTQSQEAILSALWGRACRETGRTPDLVVANGLSNIVLDDRTLDVTTIARSLSTTLFGLAGQPSNDRSANSDGHLFVVFSPAYALPLRWNSLIVFAIFNSSEVLHLNGTYLTSDHPKPEVTLYWQVIFGLASVEKILQASLATAMRPPTPMNGALETTRTLYQLWLPIMKSCLVPRDLEGSIITSLFKIASILSDATLFYDCQHLYRTMICSEARVSGQKLLAVQYVAAAVRVRGSHPDVVSTVLEALPPDLQQQQHQVLASAVAALAPIDASLAYALYSIVHGKGMELDSRATYVLAMSLAQRGAFCQAILILNNSRFSLESRGLLISAIARNIRENPWTNHPPSVFVAIINELAALYHSHAPPQHFRGHLEQLFIVLAQHGRGSQLFPVVLSIFERSPSFFQPRFLVRYCHVLIQRKQFSTASKLLHAIAAVHPKTARSLCTLTDRIVMQTKTFRAFKRTTPFRSPALLKLTSHLRRRPYSGTPLELSLQELLQSGRVLAAQHIFTSAAATLPSRRCTALGNILLHGVSRQPTSRNGRCVRKVLALFENLIKNHGFQPDRVTANILIKAMINWRSAFDSPRLRELLDQLVRSGYPAADYSPLHPPFGTRCTQFSGSTGPSDLPSFISFEKHTRPLFKMFIKAFYLCNDVEAARRVVGILKVEEYKNTIAKEARQRARSKGRVKAGQKNVVPLDVTVSSVD